MDFYPLKSKLFKRTLILVSHIYFQNSDILIIKNSEMFTKINTIIFRFFTNPKMNSQHFSKLVRFYYCFITLASIKITFQNNTLKNYQGCRCGLLSNIKKRKMRNGNKIHRDKNMPKKRCMEQKSEKEVRPISTLQTYTKL